jgi:uncharacterized damage-inducible protein DinB
MIPKPLPGEYLPWQEGYVRHVGDQDVVQLLKDQQDISYQLFTTLPAGKEDYAYAEGKWTIKQVLAHMIDTERIFAYRLLCLSRGEKQPLPGFEQDDYIKYAFVENRAIKDMAEEFKLVRSTTLYLVENLTSQQLGMTGTVIGHTFKVSFFPYVIAGHEGHHLTILKERYL